ncbi:hypothetical protein [Mycobacteroides abscessus]|uniref:hypothetical protein n=1 Tax=Mycobacteroides abscessus TaxID=36809 RepID=UPI0012FFDEEA|nr:hypothetical protein [Mycobacteroides abscessus]
MGTPWRTHDAASYTVNCARRRQPLPATATFVAQTEGVGESGAAVADVSRRRRNNKRAITQGGVSCFVDLPPHWATSCRTLL